MEEGTEYDRVYEIVLYLCKEVLHAVRLLLVVFWWLLLALL